jgi:hypothetical protein
MPIGIDITTSQVHNHCLLLDLIDLDLLYRKSSLLTRQPLRRPFLGSSLVGTGPVRLALALYAIDTDHKII